MLNEKNLQEIKKYEESGIDVIAISNDGTLEHYTQGTQGNEYCCQCCAFRLLPDPDPHDWFGDKNMKVVCVEVNGVIASSLEKPSEWNNIRKPLYCPKIGRELSEEEKESAIKMLKWAQDRM